MTPNERALLLAVGQYVTSHAWKSGQSGTMKFFEALIEAVEAEAAFAADDEDELAEVAEKARAWARGYNAAAAEAFNAGLERAAEIADESGNVHRHVSSAIRAEKDTDHD